MVRMALVVVVTSYCIKWCARVERKSGVVQSPGSASDARPVMFCIAARRLWRYTWWWDAASGHSGLKEKAAGKCHSSV